MSFLRALRLALPVLCAIAVPVFAQQAAPQPAEIDPPFSLNWHEPSERVEGKIEAAKLNVVERRKVRGQWEMTVTGFKKPNGKDVFPPTIQRVIFSFAEGQLGKA